MFLLYIFTCKSDILFKKDVCGELILIENNLQILNFNCTYIKNQTSDFYAIFKYIRNFVSYKHKKIQMVKFYEKRKIWLHCANACGSAVRHMVFVLPKIGGIDLCKGQQNIL